MDLLNGLNQTLFPGQRVIRVNGWEAGEKYPMPRDCEAIMLDENPESDYIYMKVTDSNGGEKFARYRITEEPIPKFDPDKYVTANDFNSFKEEVLSGINSLKQSINCNFGERPKFNGKQSGKSGNEFSRSEADVQSDGNKN